MPAANTMAVKRETLNLRIRPAERDLIDRAAKARGKNRTDFVLEAARAALDELQEPVEFLVGGDDLLPAISAALQGHEAGATLDLMLEMVLALCLLLVLLFFLFMW